MIIVINNIRRKLQALQLFYYTFTVYGSYALLKRKFQLNRNAKVVCLHWTDSKGTNICVTINQRSKPWCDFPVQWTLSYPEWLSGLNLCTFYLTPMLHTEQSKYTRVLEHPKVPEFHCPMPEEAKIQRLLAPTMDNMIGKETAYL